MHHHGASGQFLLVNETPFDWVKTYEHSYQMNNWCLPAKVPAWSSQQVYVEFSGAITDSTIDDAADTTYLIGGSNISFSLGARAFNDSEILGVTVDVSFKLIATLDKTECDLGWNQDGTTGFALIGQPGAWIWSGMDGSSWMQDNLPLLGNKTLKQLSIPGEIGRAHV